MKKKTIAKRSEKKCLVCGKKIRVIHYTDYTYRGGHFFERIPISTKKEREKARRAGTVEKKIGGMVVHVMRRDSKPYKFIEYWECPACYWGGK